MGETEQSSQENEPACFSKMLTLPSWMIHPAEKVKQVRHLWGFPESNSSIAGNFFFFFLLSI